MTKDDKVAGYARRRRAKSKILNASEIPTTLKLTLLTIIEQLNGETGCRLAWPSAQFIADKLGLSKRTIQRQLKIVRQLQIFDIRHFKPREATEYAEWNYGIKLRLDFAKQQAPPLYEVNGHELWSTSKKLSKESLRQFLEVMTQDPKVMTRMSLLSNDTGVIQQKEKGNAFLSSPFPSASADPSLVSDQTRVLAKPAPDRVDAVITPETSSCRYSLVNDGYHLPTHRHNPEQEPDSGKEFLLIPQAGSGSRLTASPLSESKTQGSQGGAPYPEPQEKDYSSAIELESLEPEERDFDSGCSDYPEPEERELAPVGYVSEARDGIKEATESTQDCSRPPLAQEKEEAKEEALSGAEILMRASKEREGRRRRLVPRSFCQGRKWAPVGNAAPLKMVRLGEFGQNVAVFADLPSDYE